MSDDKRILLTTVEKTTDGYHDLFKSDTQRSVFTYRFPRINSLGLRFLKYNIPEIDILEYPSKKTYIEALKKDYDVLGYSFYVNDVPDITRMIKTARSHAGELKIIGGNYGALTPGIEEHFDELIIGYSEDRIADMVGKKIEDLKHPPIIWYIQTVLGIKITPVGILFTTRGCTIKCEFCQTPSFCKKNSKIPLDSLREVIGTYRDRGISTVIIFDENFSLYRKHTEKAIEILKENDMHWFCMTSVSSLYDNWEKWYDMNMLGAFIGIESFSHDIRESMKKITMDIDSTIEFLRQVNEHLFLLGFFIIGYDSDTKESIKEQVKLLGSIGLDHTQIRILTPLPQTPLWYSIDEKYGIFETDWSKFDTTHLVWNHPNFKPSELREILMWSLSKCHPRRISLETQAKFARRFSKERGLLRAGDLMLRNLFYGNTIDYKD